MSDDVKTESAPVRATHALIFELEYVAAKKRQVEFISTKSAVKTKGVDLTPVMFARSGMSPLSRAAITSVLKLAGKKFDAIEKANHNFENHNEHTELRDQCLDNPEMDINESRKLLLDKIGSNEQPTAGGMRVNSGFSPA